MNNFFNYLILHIDTNYINISSLVFLLLALVGAGVLSPTVLHWIHSIIPIKFLMPMPGVRCPKCLKEDIEIWVIPGKYCPKCKTPCRKERDIHIIFLLSIIFVCTTLLLTDINTNCMVLYDFASTTTSHFISTFSMGFTVVLGANRKIPCRVIVSKIIFISIIFICINIFLFHINRNLNSTIEMDLNMKSLIVFNQIADPLLQFKIRDVIGISAPVLLFTRLSITNIGSYLTLGIFLLLMFNRLSLNIKNIAANTWSTSKQLVYDTLYSITINQINSLKGQNYFPFIYALFFFILVHNLIGMVPYDFASTTHFISTFSLSFTVVLGSTFIGFALYKLLFFGFFVPSGCPLLLLYLLVLIEFISYIARNFSLGLRLAANILSGHMLLNILSEFTSKILISTYFILTFIPYIFVIMFSALEFGIAFIQAQVFAVLSSSYIKDGLSLH